MFLDWEPAQQKDYDDLLAAVRSRLGGASAAGPAGAFTRDDWRACGDLALLGLCVPVEYGGGGLGALDTAHLVEAFGRGCPNTGLVFAASAHLFACAVPVAAFGSVAMRERLLPGMCDGRLVAANAMTEREAGSDVSAMATRAVAEADGYRLTGEKSWVSNAPAADVVITYAVTDPSAGFLGITAFAVDRDTPGLSISEPLDKLGLDGCPAGRVTFEDCRVPATAVIGEPGQGSAIFQHSMGWERACLFAGYVGLMDRLLEDCVAHLRRRRQFGRRLADFQALSHRVAEMKLRLEGARWLLYRACFRLDRGEPATMEIALSKLAVSEAAVQSALDAVRLFGSRGYLTGEGPEQVLRDALPATLFSGTSEIQREFVARGVGL
jgi:alkylation response protein AidB-like acyl-CoA dehydrogenase